MSEATIRARIKTILEGISDIGVVHDYERTTADWSKYLELFKTTISGTDQIRGVQIAYRGFVPNVDDMDTCDIIRAHSFVIIFLVGLNDADKTEKIASAMVNTIADALDSDSTLNGLSYVGLEPTSVPTFEPRVFGSVLCNYAEITKVVQEEHNWSA